MRSSFEGSGSTTVARLRRLAGLGFLIAFAGCSQDKGIIIILRDEENQPVPMIEIRESRSDRRLGETDPKGQVTLALERKRGEVVRLRCQPVAGSNIPAYEIEDPIILTDSDFARGSRLIRARRIRGESGTAAVLRVETEPPGAEVVIGEDPVGRTSVAISDLTPGRIEVALRLEGYKEHKVELLLQEGENTYRWELQRESGQPPDLRPIDSSVGAERESDRKPPRGTTEEKSTGRTERVPATPPEIAPAPDPGGTSTGALEPSPSGTAESKPTGTPDHRQPESGSAGSREAEPPPASEASRIQSVIHAYRDALESLNVERYSELWASLSDQDRHKIEQAFRDLKSQTVEVQDVVIEIKGQDATARFEERRKMSFLAGKDLTNHREMTMLLRREGDGRWRITQLK